MNKILQNTHRISNINVLKARDYYFEKARHWHRVRRWLTLIPPILLAISYIPLLPHYDIVAEQRDLFIGIITIIAFIIIHFICEKQITHNLDISNMLREEYDCKVLDIPHNPFTYCTEELQTYLSKASNIPDYYKYEVWYSEIFGDNGPRNALIAQLDNILYTYYAYKEYKRYIIISLSFLLVISLVSLQLGITVFALVVISLFNAIPSWADTGFGQFTKAAGGAIGALTTITKQYERVSDLKAQSAIKKKKESLVNEYIQDKMSKLDKDLEKFRPQHPEIKNITDDEKKRIVIGRLGVNIDIDDKPPGKEDMKNAFDIINHKRALQIMNSEDTVKNSLLDLLYLDRDASLEEIESVLRGD